MLKKFLEEKPLYYNEIDYTRMPRVYERISSHFTDADVIHIIGTNGKGTTGRFLASALHSTGKKVGHYTSPHILEFNERIWLNGKNASDEKLDGAHQELQRILTDEELSSLSYFEYTTLLAMMIFKGCDYVVLEAGLGGEYDATAVFDNILTLVTPIDIDHEAFLGDSIEKIARTKLNAVRKNAIIAPQKYDEVYRVAEEIVSEKAVSIYMVEEFLDEYDALKVENISKKLNLVRYLKENLILSISALKFLGVKYSADDFDNARLFGRLSRISENIIVDVGHNPLAARSIAESLKGEKYILVYNSYKDKNYKEILTILKPLIIHVELINIIDERIELKSELKNTLISLDIKCSTFKGVTPEHKYLVFGSFSVVEEFLKVYK